MTISANYSSTRPSILLDFSNQTVLDPRVTFARTTTAYYYDNKSAALAEQNLLLYSNTLTNAVWTPTGMITSVQNVTDPTGTANNAWTIQTSASNTYHSTGTTTTQNLATGVVYTASAYLQAGTSNFASLSCGGVASSAWATVTFNLTSGSVGVGQYSSNGTMAVVANSALITQVGSTNWYRCSFQYTTSIAAPVGLGVGVNNTATPTITVYGVQNWNAAGTETILVYGAQIEQAKNLTTYTPTVYTATTATAVNTYTPTLQTAAINAPRFDYDPVTRQSLGLLLEQQSQNLALYSSDYTNAAWTKGGVTITAAADISPDGMQNAQLMVSNTASSSKYIQQSPTFTASAYTFSVYAKNYAATAQNFLQLTTTSNGNCYANFDLISGTAGTISGGANIISSGIQSVGNGWYRCSITWTAGAGSGANINILQSNSITAAQNVAFTGNGFNGVLIWGAQLEAAPSATSYIANPSNTANTRTVDSASMTGTNFTSWYNYSGGTVYVEAASGNPTTATSPTSVWFTDGSTTNQIGFWISTTGVNTYAKINNVAVQNLNVSLPSASVANTFYKTSWYFSTAGNGVSSAGQTATTYATAIVAPAITTLNLGSQAGQSLINGRIKKFAYYPAVLTNTQIQSLSAN